ncbi:flagellar protein FlaG [Paenibacillus sp. PDC88]|uniref:flagellar protein FlaG n=1 Tax=Paenibacillus sp. PDC88 TaxID=1884375 RepID=UPI000895B06F|nr:flagellar protein FlaG [Paenibacillus sp. PDC88]SDW83757.1 flagellar protein FlaG [Paenibacillus sp. PDC88]
MESRISGSGVSFGGNYGRTGHKLNNDNEQLTIAALSREEEIAVQELEKSIRAIQGTEKTIQFSIHEQTNAIMIKVVDKTTGEVIREIPREKLLDVTARMMEINGLIIDKRA